MNKRVRLIRAIAGLAFWPYTREAAEEYGRLAARLQRAGRTMQQVAMQVAAIALTLSQCVVASEDTDLRAVPGLSVERWKLHALAHTNLRICETERFGAGCVRRHNRG